jgi:hypothetical protein
MDCVRCNGGAIDGCFLSSGCFGIPFFMLLPEYGTSFPSFKEMVTEFVFWMGNDCVRCGEWGGSNFLSARVAAGDGAMVYTGHGTLRSGETTADDCIRRFSKSRLGVKATGVCWKFPDGTLPAGRGIDDATRCSATLFIGGGGGCCRCCKLPGLPVDRGMVAARCGGTLIIAGGLPTIPAGRSND